MGGERGAVKTSLYRVVRQALPTAQSTIAVTLSCVVIRTKVDLAEIWVRAPSACSQLQVCASSPSFTSSVLERIAAGAGTSSEDRSHEGHSRDVSHPLLSCLFAFGSS